MSGIVWHIDYGFVKLFWICYSVNTTKVFLIFYGKRGREFGDIVRGGRETCRVGGLYYSVKKWVIGRDLTSK